MRASLSLHRTRPLLPGGNSFRRVKAAEMLACKPFLQPTHRHAPCVKLCIDAMQHYALSIARHRLH